MGVYLKQFENHTKYDNYINGNDAILPNVSLCVQENDVHYNPYVQETRLVTKYNVTDTSNPTKIINSYVLNQLSAIEIDDVKQQSVVSEYTFNTTGEHTVKCTLTDPTTISNSVFYNCSSLISVTIPDNVTSIGMAVFYNCFNLTSIDIPNSVTSIGEAAFNFCSGLKSITIGNSVTSISDNAFNNCSGLTSITINTTTPPTLGSFAFNNTNNCPIYVPSASVETYKAATSWSNYTDRIQAIS